MQLSGETEPTTEASGDIKPGTQPTTPKVARRRLGSNMSNHLKVHDNPSENVAWSKIQQWYI